MKQRTLLFLRRWGIRLLLWLLRLFPPVVQVGFLLKLPEPPFSHGLNLLFVTSFIGGLAEVWYYGVLAYKQKWLKPITGFLLGSLLVAMILNTIFIL